MPPDTMQEVTWRLPIGLVQRIEQVAKESQRSVEDIIIEILESALPPIRNRRKTTSETSS